MQTYFFKNNINDLVKIGRSENAEKRAAGVVGQCHFIEIQILHIIDGDYENHFHKLYQKFRKEGEWFCIPGLTVDKINYDLETHIKPKIKVLIPQKQTLLSRNDFSVHYCGLFFSLMQYYGQAGRTLMSELDDIEEPIDSIDVRFSDGGLLISKNAHKQYSAKNNIKGLMDLVVKYPGGERGYSIREVKAPPEQQIFSKQIKQ